MSRARDFLAWATQMFGPVARHRDERAARFVEEAIELAHAEGLNPDTLHRIVDRVCGGPRGDVTKEAGQAMCTLEMLAFNAGFDLETEAHIEFDRVQSIPPEEWHRRHAAKVRLGIANLSRVNGGVR